MAASNSSCLLSRADLFAGQLRSSLHCSVCSHYSNTFDVFCDLSLPIPKRGSIGEVTLRDCLDLFSQEEKLDKENSPVCSHRLWKIMNYNTTISNPLVYNCLIYLVNYLSFVNEEWMAVRCRFSVIQARRVLSEWVKSNWTAFNF